MIMKITVAIPCYNEAPILEKAVRLAYRFFTSHLAQHDWRLIIADNCSTDGTAKNALKLMQIYPNLHYTQAPTKGKGIAIKTAWLNHPSDIYIFLDADLATDLEVVPRMINALITADLAIGSRFHSQSHTTRTVARWLYAHAYRLFLKLILNTNITDAPCGAKAIKHHAWQQLAPKTINTQWFFDSELVLKAEQHNFSITELPVTWSASRIFPNRTSKALPLNIIREYIKEVLKIRPARIDRNTKSI